MIGFDGGYVAYEFWGRAWFSADGITWQQVSVGAASSCDSVEDDVRNDVITTGASNGASVVLAGVEPRDPEAEFDDGIRDLVTWTSSDGQTWVRSPHVERDAGSQIHSVWPVEGAWEATLAVTSEDDEVSSIAVWRSSYGLNWERVSEELWSTNWIDASLTARATGSDQNGTRVMSAAIVGGGAVDPQGPFVFGDPELLVSHDGREWTPLVAQFMTSGDLFVSHVLAPTQASGAWTLITHDRYLRSATAWTSADLQSWSEHDLPLASVDHLVASQAGLILDGCRHGGRCAQFVSHDGVHWSEITPHLHGAGAIVEGPAGVLLVGRESGRVWMYQAGPAGRS